MGFNSDTSVDWESARDAFTSARGRGEEKNVPAEAYLVRINKIDIRVSKANNPYLNIEYRIISSLTREDDDDIGDPEEFKNMPIFGMAMLNHEKDGAMRTLRQLEVAVGFDAEDGSQTLDDLITLMKDSHVRVTTKIKKSDDYPDKLEIGRIMAATEDTIEDDPFE